MQNMNEDAVLPYSGNIGGDTLFSTIARAVNFIAKIAAGEDFLLAKSTKTVKLSQTLNKEVIELLSGWIAKKDNRASTTKLTLFTDKGKKLKFADLAKTAEFGGQPTGLSIRHETAAIDALNLLINNAIIDDVKNKIYNNANIFLKIGENEPVLVARAIKTPNNAVKSDFELEQLKNNAYKSVIWISHKAGTKASDFQQYGGISDVGEPEIAKHAETLDFISDLQKAYTSRLTSGMNLYRPIKDPVLKNKSVYGNEFTAGGINGRQNVTALLQGKVTLTKVNKSDKFWVLSTESKKVHLNGDEMTGEYEPVFAASFRDRNSKYMKCARLGIYPRAKTPKNATALPNLPGKAIPIPVSKDNTSCSLNQSRSYGQLLTLREYINLELEPL